MLCETETEAWGDGLEGKHACCTSLRTWNQIYIHYVKARYVEKVPVIIVLLWEDEKWRLANPWKLVGQLEIYSSKDILSQ